MRTDTGLELACYEMGLLTMVEVRPTRPSSHAQWLILVLQELINAIHVFVIRIVERRIDQILDAALLDHESMSEFSDVTFEGEWNFLKSLTSRGATAKRNSARAVPRARDIFAPAMSAGSPRASVDLDGFKSPDMASQGGSSLGGGLNGGRPMSVADFRTPSSWSPQPGATSMTSETSSATQSRRSASQEEEVTPKTITSFLTSVLVVLQLYEVNPAVTCQAFSQVYYWVGCEVFNRILTRKKYLCRSKAVQIRMNMTQLEDWIRDRCVRASPSVLASTN